MQGMRGVRSDAIKFKTGRLKDLWRTMLRAKVVGLQPEEDVYQWKPGIIRRKHLRTGQGFNHRTLCAFPRPALAVGAQYCFRRERQMSSQMPGSDALRPRARNQL